MRQPLEIFSEPNGDGIAAVKFATPGLDVRRLHVARRLVDGTRARAFLYDVGGAAWVSTPQFAVRHLELSGQRQPIPRGMRIFLGHE